MTQGGAHLRSLDVNFYDGIQLISYALGAEYIPAGGIFGHHTLSGDELLLSLTDCRE